MKKLVVLLIVLALSSGMMFAAESGLVVLSGGVGQTASIVIDPMNNYNALDLSKNAAVTNLVIAAVNETTNGNAGYTVVLQTSNGFQLYNGTNLTGVSYSFTYGGTTYTNAQLVSNEVTITDSSTGATGSGLDKDASITYDVNGITLPAGTYTDTLTFIISNKA